MGVVLVIVVIVILIKVKSTPSARPKTGVRQNSKVDLPIQSTCYLSIETVLRCGAIVQYCITVNIAH